MKHRLRGTWLVLLLAVACSHGGSMENSVTQDRFGVRMARMNLWREAMFRFKRAVQLDPASAMAHNNLAVSYEANGDFDGAMKEYREALRLDRSNQYIQKNYSRFVEFTSRNKKRQQKQETANAAASDAAAASAVTSSAPRGQPGEPVPVVPVPVPSPSPPPATPPPANPSGEIL